MDPIKKDITIRRGNTKEIFFRVRTRVWDAVQEKFVAGPYKDLTGHTIAAQVRLDPDSPEPLLTFTVTPGDQSDLALGRGSVLLKISDEATATVPLNVANGVWDCLFTEPDGDAFTYIEGTVTFAKGVTR